MKQPPTSRYISIGALAADNNPAAFTARHLPDDRAEGLKKGTAESDSSKAVNPNTTQEKENSDVPMNSSEIKPQPKAVLPEP